MIARDMVWTSGGFCTVDFFCDVFFLFRMWTTGVCEFSWNFMDEIFGNSLSLVENRVIKYWYISICSYLSWIDHSSITWKFHVSRMLALHFCQWHKRFCINSTWSFDFATNFASARFELDKSHSSPRPRFVGRNHPKLTSAEAHSAGSNDDNHDWWAFGEMDGFHWLILGVCWLVQTILSLKGPGSFPGAFAGC